MKIDLKQQLAAKHKRAPLVMRPIETTQYQAQDLARLYIRVLRVWVTGVQDRILPEYSRSLKELVTDSPIDLEGVIQTTDEGAVSEIFSFRSLLRAWMGSMLEWHTQRFVSTLKYSTNVDLSTQLTAADPETASTIEETLARNTALVRSVSDQVRAQISDIVFRGLQARTPVRDVAREISKVTGLSRARSLRIASDQTVKLSSALDRERQLQVGMSKFKWRHSGKVHYRPHHKERDGKIFSWTSKVAKEDPPGHAPFCGCKAMGVLDG